MSTIPLGGPLKPSVLAPTIELALGSNLASAATISTVTAAHKVTGTTTVTTVNPPYPTFIGEITLIAQDGFALATGGNIAASVNLLAGQRVTLFYDGTSWYPVGGGGGSIVSNDLIPSLDNTYKLGDATHRWSSVYTLGVNSGASGLTFNSNVGAATPAFSYTMGTSHNNGIVSQWTDSVAGTFQIGITAGTYRLGGTVGNTIQYFNGNLSGLEAAAGVTASLMVGGGYALRAYSTKIVSGADNTITMGDSTDRWSNLYTANIVDRLDNVLTGQTVGFSIQNTTPATNVQQQYSPMLELQGRAWSSGSGTSDTQKLALQARTIFAASSTAELVLWQSSAGAAYSEALRITPYTTAGFSTGWNMWAGSLTQPYGIGTDLSHTYISAGGLFASTLDLTASAVYPHTDNAFTDGLAGNRWQKTYTLAVDAGASGNLNLNSASAVVQNVGSIATVLSASGFYPGADNTSPTGLSSNRWTNVYTLGVNSGGSGLSFTAGSNFTFTGPANNTQINFTDGTTLAQFFVGVGTAQFGTVTAGAPVTIVSGNASRVYVDSTGTYPAIDNTYVSGSAARRWSNVYTTKVDGGTGTLLLNGSTGVEIDGAANQNYTLLTLKQGSTPGANPYFFKAVDSAGVVHAWMDSGGYLNLDAINGGINGYADGAGAVDYVAQLASNNTAATAGVPVQAPGGFGHQGSVWDTGTLTAKTSRHFLISHPVSGNPAYGEWFINSIITGGGTKRVFTISDGAVSSGPTGWSFISANTTSPILYAPTTAIIKGGSTMGAGTGVSVVIDSTSTVAGGFNDRLLSFKNNGTEVGFITAYSSAGIKISGTTGNTYLSLDGPVVGFQWVLGGSSAMFFDNTNSLYPGADVTYTLGKSANRWSEVWARRHAGVEQTIAAAATITIDPAAGETVRITLGATAITLINAGTGYPGEVMRVEVIQDATGGRSISGWSSSFKLINNGYTPTSTANAIDVLSFMWDASTSKWVEYDRSLNIGLTGTWNFTNYVANGASARAFLYNNTTNIATAGGAIAAWQSAGTEVASIMLRDQVMGGNGWGLDVNGPGHITTHATDGATAVGLTIRNYNAFSTTGSKLISVLNNATEKFYLTKEGYTVAGGTAPTASVDTVQLGATASATVTGTAQYGRVAFTTSNTPSFTANTTFLTLTLPHAFPTGAVCQIFPVDSNAAAIMNSTAGKIYSAQNSTNQIIFKFTGTGVLTAPTTYTFAYRIDIW